MSVDSTVKRTVDVDPLTGEPATVETSNSRGTIYVSDEETRRLLRRIAEDGIPITGRTKVVIPDQPIEIQPVREAIFPVINKARYAGPTYFTVVGQQLLIPDVQGNHCCAITTDDSSGTWQLVVEGSIDGVNWSTLPLNLFSGGLLVSQASAVISSNASFLANTTPFRQVRVRASSFTSGSVRVQMHLMTGLQTISLSPSSAVVGAVGQSSTTTVPGLGSGGSAAPWLVAQKPSPLCISATAAVNTGVTATLPAAGAGTFHYITSIQVMKLYSVIGVAAGAGVIITTTNLPGSLAFTTEQVVGVAGSVVRVVDYKLTSPLKCSVANTNTTIVAPAQLQTIWRVNVHYYAE